MHKHLMLILLLLCPALALAAVIPEATDNDGPTAIAQNGRQLSMAWLMGRIDDLDETLRAWWKEKRRFKDGRFEILAYYEGLCAYFKVEQDKWDAYRDLAAMHQQAYPHSTAAALAKSIFWYQYAWNARGTGFADSVAPENWTLFHERLAKARGVLEESRSFAASNPLWYYHMMSIAIDEGWPDEKFDELFGGRTNRSSAFRTSSFSISPRPGICFPSGAETPTDSMSSSARPLKPPAPPMGNRCMHACTGPTTARRSAATCSTKAGPIGRA